MEVLEPVSLIQNDDLIAENEILSKNEQIILSLTRKGA